MAEHGADHGVTPPWWGRGIDLAQLAFGLLALPPLHRLLDAVDPAILRAANHEAAANQGRSFIAEASALQKALFVLKLLGSYDGAPLSDVQPEGPLDRPSALAGDAAVEAEVIFFGDLLFVSDLGRRSLTPALRRRLQQADRLVINLEGTVGEQGCELYPFQSWRGLRQLFDWNRSGAVHDWVARFAEDQLAELLADLPPTSLTLAGNHTLDEGREGLDRTIAALARLGAQHVGNISKEGANSANEDAASALLQVGRQRVGLVVLGFGQNHTPETCGLRFTAVPYRLPLERLREHARKLLDAGAEQLIASLHWGYEHERAPREDQLRCVAELWDLGFDQVIGHHPHIVQGGSSATRPERSPQRAWYSLGDFLGGDRTIFNRFSYAVALQCLSDGRWRTEVLPLTQSPYYAPQQQTGLLWEASPLEKAVWRHLFRRSVQGNA